tara:strand:- start:3158 stop:4495 length:1338 start_codon:yes stop_codon:yes gene_type:complete
VSNLFSNLENPEESSKLTTPTPVSVSALSKRIHNALEGGIGRVDVVGQINSPKLGKHWYFTLADGEAKIDCAMWASRVSAIKSGEFDGGKPKQGDLVIVRGTVGHYAKYGKTQMYVERMKSAGDEKGSLQQEFDTLIKELRDKGWFDQAHKKALPMYPRKIAVITSASSAAVRDVIETARRRWTAVELIIVNVPVQGKTAASSIVKALKRVDAVAQKSHIDAIIVTRGGGSLEELWSFNDHEVVEAAFHCTTPIVAAIGHESDTSIIELVADHRASTPTQAAMVLVPDSDELTQMVDHYYIRLLSVVQRVVELGTARIRHAESQLASCALSQVHRKRARLSALSEALAARRPDALVQKRHKTVLSLGSALQSHARRLVAQSKATIDTLQGKLDAIDPAIVLKRGFSLTEDVDGNLIRCVAEVKEGQQIRTVVADGAIESTVECTI